VRQVGHLPEATEGVNLEDFFSRYLEQNRGIRFGTREAGSMQVNSFQSVFNARTLKEMTLRCGSSSLGYDPVALVNMILHVWDS
jgi:hypothetical protein